MSKFAVGYPSSLPRPELFMTLPRINILKLVRVDYWFFIGVSFADLKDDFFEVFRPDNSLNSFLFYLFQAADRADCWICPFEWTEAARAFYGKGAVVVVAYVSRARLGQNLADFVSVRRGDVNN